VEKAWATARSNTSQAPVPGISRVSARTAAGKRARNRKMDQRRHTHKPKTFLTIAIIGPDCIGFFLWLGRR